MIQHVVMLSLPSEYDAAELADVMTGLAALVDVIPGFVTFSHGPNRDFEAKSQAYSYGFVGVFSDSDAVASYASDAMHQALGGRLVALVGGDADNIWVADIDTQAGPV